MTQMSVVVIAAALLVVAILFHWALGIGSGAPKPYRKSDLDDYSPVPLLNKAELRLFLEVKRFLPSNLHLVAKPRMEDVIGVKRGLDRRTRASRRGRVKSRHFDMALIDDTATVVAVIELDGSFHSQRGVAKADRFKDQLCDRVGIPMFRVHSRSRYREEASRITSAVTPRHSVRRAG